MLRRRRWHSSSLVHFRADDIGACRLKTVTPKATGGDETSAALNEFVSTTLATIRGRPGMFM